MKSRLSGSWKNTRVDSRTERLTLGDPERAVDVRPLVVRRVLHGPARFATENALLGDIGSNFASYCVLLSFFASLEEPVPLRNASACT